MAIKKRLCGCLFFIFEISTLILLVFCYAQEKITFTAYYPSPTAKYREVTAQRMKIGSTYEGSSVVVGNDNLIVQGNVSIGTTIANTTRLNVNGTLKTVQFQMTQSAPPIQVNSTLLANDTNGTAFWAPPGFIVAACRVITGPNSGYSTINCLANETLVGTGSTRSADSNVNGVWIINNSGNPASDNTTPLGYGTACSNTGDKCRPQAVCCTF